LVALDIHFGRGFTDTVFLLLETVHRSGFEKKLSCPAAALTLVKRTLAGEPKDTLQSLPQAEYALYALKYSRRVGIKLSFVIILEGVIARQKP